MKYLFGIVILLICELSRAQGGSLNLAIPSAPGSYLSDRFRAGELDCSMAIGSGTNVEFGVVGIIGNNNNQVITTNPVAPNTKDVGVYGRIIIPIGAPRGRVDCNRLYEMELAKRAIEIEKLERELKNMRKDLNFEK